jgi:hypothetical protein
LTEIAHRFYRGQCVTGWKDLERKLTGKAMMEIRLREWIARFHAKLNNKGGCLTHLGSLVGITLAVLSPLTGSIWFIVAGSSLGVVGLGYILYEVRASRPPRLNAEQLRNRVLTLEKLKEIRGHCVTVALVGAGQTGKTTLRDHLTSRTPNRIHTIAPEMVVIQAPSPVEFLAYLDAAGEELTQQFEIVDHADVLVVLLDHNVGHAERSTRIERKNEQGYGVVQLIHKLRQRADKGDAILAIHVLRNKHDLWSGGPDAQLANLTAWFDEQIGKLRAVMLSGTVSDDTHSNERTADIVRVREKIEDLARTIATRRLARP